VYPFFTQLVNTVEKQIIHTQKNKIMKTEKTNNLGSCPCLDGNNEDNSSNKDGMMKCMKSAKWFLLFPGVLIALAFLLGYFLEPATVRMLWLIITGALLVLGTSFYLFMNFRINSSHNNCYS